ncbi:MAG: DUF6600 domain-containing protein [Rhodanobacter sp.]
MALRRHGAALAIMLACAGAGVVHAQATTGDDGVEPPSRVARLSYLAGDVGLLPAGASDWSDASVNRPLTTGDKLSSGDDARAELEFGGATVRLAHRTDVGVLDLNEQLAQVELTQGALNLSVRHLDDGQSYEIDTPTVAVVIDQPGSFRVDIDGDATRVTAFEGNATVYGENNARRDVASGRSYRFVDSSLAAVAISDIGGGDNFDAWVDQREQRYAQSDTDQYVPDGMVGAQDLDQYGQWQDSSDYGAVWYPSNVAVGWAPYRDGRWAYIAPWGWTWIDAMPWGYAPYHYGRWAHTQRGWGWIPGPRYARPIYAPALVAFVGGGGFSVGIGSGPVGWFPLGPGEIYNPWYRCNRDYYRRVNVSNIRITRNITNVTINDRINNHYGHYRDNRQLPDERYVNRRAPGGFSAMPGRQFAAGDRVQRNLVKVDQRQLESAKVVPRGVGLRPLPGSRTGERSAHVRQLPVAGFQRQVVARHAPAAQVTPRAEQVAQRLRSRRPGTSTSHVRVLDRSTGAPARRASINPARTEAGADRARSSRGSDGVADPSLVERRVRDGTATPRNELPSARFAHPQRIERASEAPGSARPGVSYISNADQDRRQRTPRSTLPQVPQIQAADRSERAAEVRAEPRSLNSSGRVPTATIERARPEPRTERAEFARPSRVRDEPRPQPVNREPPRQVMQQPRYQPPRIEQPRAEAPRFAQPQRAAPPARAEAARPQRSEARPERKSDQHRSDDGQRQ